MSFWFGLLLFTSFFWRSEAFHCPNGSIQIQTEDVCIFAVTEPKLYFNVIRGCAALGGIPAKIQNIFENTYVFAMVGQNLSNQAPYIGVERNEQNVWAYSDGSPLTYPNWALNEPNNSSNTSVCVIMDPQSGKWVAAECSISRPYFCSINGDDVQCPNGWVYNVQSDYCYYLQNFTYPDSVHWQSYNWTTAEANCQRMNSHLVSIHSKDEDNFVYGLITSNMKNMSIAAPYNDSCTYQRAWIGYYGNGTLGTGTWTDGSPVDYFGRVPYSSPYPWSMSNDQSCNMKLWVPTSVTGPWARFVCKMSSRTRITLEKMPPWKQRLQKKLFAP